MTHGFVFLAVSTTTTVVLVIGALALGVGLGLPIVNLFGKRTIGWAGRERDRIVADAEREAQTIREKADLEAERRVIERREKAEEEFNRIREELREQERRLTKREDNLDKKLDTLVVKERHLDERSQALERAERQNEQVRAEIERLRDEQRQHLLRITNMTEEQAREAVLARFEDELRHELNAIAMERYAEAEAEAKNRGREVVVNAIQRYAGEYVSESTVRAIPIPSDDLKGRIIGREGRNIRAIERATGVDVMVDDTPGIISVSCFDKVRQAIAAEALQRLIEDGRIHPTRIEEIVNKVREEIEEKILQYGKQAAIEAKIRGLHPKIIEAMGKMHFRTSYGQNVLKHSIEVAYLSQIIADQLGLDGALARRCGFLHDIGKAMDHEMEGGHPKIGMEFCKKYGEREEVLNAVGGHHGDIPATSPYTPIVMAADAVSGARPGARRESMEHYIQRLTQLEDIAKANDGVVEAYAIQAGREVRVIIDADRTADPDAFGIARNIAKRVSEEMTFPGEIKVTVLRETRAIEFAT